MADDFGNVSVTPPVAPVRDARRLQELVVRMNKEIPAVKDAEGIEIVAAIPAGTRVEKIEVRYTNFSSTNEKTDANPNGILSESGANSYTGANVNALKGNLFKAGAKAEIEARLAEDNIDE